MHTRGFEPPHSPSLSRRSLPKLEYVCAESRGFEPQSVSRPIRFQDGPRRHQGLLSRAEEGVLETQRLHAHSLSRRGPNLRGSYFQSGGRAN